jgi:hypothetical protein
MDTPILQILWLHRRPFLVVMCLTFLALAIGIFMLPGPPAIVRTSIEIGAIEHSLQPIEPLEQVSKRIPEVYVPAIVVEMAKKGTPPSILRALQNTSSENIGRSLIVTTAIDLSATPDAKAFQEEISNRIIKDETPHTQILREEIATRIELTKRASDNLDRQTSSIAKELETIGTLNTNLQHLTDDQQANLPSLLHRLESAQESGDRPVIENKLRELYGQISNQLMMMSNLAVERARLTRDLGRTNEAREWQIQQLADAQLERKSFAETRVSMAPSVMPITARYRRLSLLFVAIVVSFLVAFGTVVLLHNVSEPKVGR